MAFGTEGSSSGGESSAVESGATETSAETTGSGYSVTDPGYEAAVPADDDLAALIAENTKKKPSETSDDASDTTDTDGETEEVVETPSADSADFDISDELLDRAVAVGYELDDIREFKDAKAFEKELARVERLQQRLQVRKPDAESVETPEPPEQKEPNWDQLIEDGHDPDMVALQKSNWQRASAAEAMVKQLREAELARNAEAQSARFDESLNGLGDEYQSILGKGRIGDLRKSSPEIAVNREKVFSMMAMLRNGYQQNGQTVPPESELIQQAVQAAFFKQAQEIARNGVKRQIRNSGSQALSRPRSGGSKELAGPERALAKEREFWKSHS